jgi:hypothetical protein
MIPPAFKLARQAPLVPVFRNPVPKSMPSVVATSPSCTLFSKDGKLLHDGIPLDWRALSREKGTVVKLVVGQLASGKDSTIQLSDPFPKDFTELFPGLTHLHLWNIDGLTRNMVELRVT